MKVSLRSVAGRLGVCVFALVLTAPALATAPSPIASIQQVVKDFAGQESWQTVCTAFSVDEPRGLFMTAAHCLADQMRLDGHIVWAVYVNEAWDVAVLETRGVRRPALVPCDANPAIGDPVVSVGHAYGFPYPMSRYGRVSAYGEVPIEVPRVFMLLDTPLIGGMSGGPMLSAAGCVVSVNQMANAHVGLGIPLDVLKTHTAQFWARP